MNTLTGKILTLPKMSGSVSTSKALSGNVGAKTINIGEKGDDGATFVPSISADGVISWTNDKGLPNPEPVNIAASFETDNTLILADGILRVNTTNIAEKDNTLPITSAGVDTIVGNIGAILDTI